MSIKYYSDQIDKLQEDLYRYNPNAFQQELESPEIDEGPSISSVLGNVGKGFVSGFTTLKIGEEADNTVDSIAYSIGHLLGFIGFVPGPGMLGKIGFKALAKNAGFKGVEKYLAKAIPGIQLKSVPMFAADKIMSGLGKFKALEPATESIKFLQNPIAKDVIQGAAHLGFASSVSSWQDGVSGMMDGFVGGATFGGFSRVLGNYVGAKGKLEFGKHQFPTDPKKAKLVDDSIKGLTGAIAMGMPSTLQGAPLEIQIYEYLLNGYFGFKEMPYYRRGALNEINKVNSHEKRFRLLDPSHEKNGIDGFKNLDPLVQESLQEIAEFEFGRMVAGKNFSNIELTIAMAQDEAQSVTDAAIKDGKISKNDGIKAMLNWSIENQIVEAVKENNALPKDKQVSIQKLENKVVKEARIKHAEEQANKFYIEEIAGKYSLNETAASFIYNMGLVNDNISSSFKDNGIPGALSSSINDISTYVYKAINPLGNETVNELEVKSSISNIAIEFMGNKSDSATNIPGDFTGEAEYRIRKNTKSPEKVNVLGSMVENGKQMFVVDGIEQKLIDPKLLYIIKNKVDYSLDAFVARIQDDFGITLDKDSLEYKKFVKTYRVITDAKPIIRKLLDSNGNIVSPAAINKYGVKRSDEFAPLSFIDDIVQVFGIGGKDVKNPSGVMHIKGFQDNEKEISIHEAIDKGLTTEAKIIYNAFKENLSLYGGVKANDELIFGLPLIDRSTGVGIKKQKKEVFDIISLLKKEIWSKEETVNYDKDKAKFVKDLEKEDYKGRFENDWTIEDIYDFDTANNVKFLMKFNEIDNMPSLIQHIKDGHILYKAPELNKRMQVFATRAPKLSSEWINDKAINPDTKNGVNFVILNSVNSDKSSHFPGEDAPSYKYIDENGIEQIAFHKARYDGGVLVRSDIFDAMTEYFGFDKSVGAIKGVQIGSDKIELGFIGKLAFHRADPKIDAILKRQNIHMFHFDSTAKQKGNRASYDWTYLNGNLNGPQKAKISTLPWESIMAFKSEDAEQVNGFTRLYKQIMTNVGPNTELGKNLRSMIGLEIQSRVQGDASELAKLDSILAVKGETPENIKQLDKIDIDKLGVTRLAEIIDKDGGTHLWKRIMRDVFNITKESLESDNDGITEPTFDAFIKDMQANEGLAKRILSSGPITSDTLKLPGVNKYVEATLKRYFIAHVLSPKIEFSTTATFTPPGMEISKSLRPGEYYLGEGYRKLVVLRDKNNKGVTLEEAMANPEKYDIPLDDALKNKNGLDATIQFKNSDVLNALAGKSKGSELTLGDVAHKNFYIGDGVYIMPNNKNQKIYVTHNGETNVDGKIVHTYSVSKPKANYKQLVARGPVDSASAARILKFKGFSGVAGYGITTHDEEYMGMSGADNDIDTAAVYFGFNNKSLYKAYMDYYSDPVIKNQFYKMNAAGERVFLPPKQDARLLDKKNTKAMTPFSPFSQITANKYAYEGNKLLGQGLSYMNSMIDLFDSIPIDKNGKRMLIGEKDSTEPDGQKRYKNSWSAEIIATRESLEKLKRDIIQYAADSSDGYKLQNIEQIRDMVKDAMFSIKHLNRRGENLGSIQPSKKETFTSEDTNEDITYELFNLNWNKEFAGIRAYEYILKEKIGLDRKFNFLEVLVELKKLDAKFPGVELPPYANALRTIGKQIKYKEAVIKDIVDNPSSTTRDFFALLNSHFPNYMTEKDGMSIINSLFKLANEGNNKEIKALFLEKGYPDTNPLVKLASELKKFAGRQQIVVTPKNLNELSSVRSNSDLAPYEILFEKGVQDIMDVTSAITTYKYGKLFSAMLKGKGYKQEDIDSYVNVIQVTIDGFKKSLHKARQYDKESRAIGKKFSSVEEKQDLSIYDTIEKYKANLKTQEAKDYFDALLMSSLDKQALPLNEFLKNNIGRSETTTKESLKKEWWSTNFDTTLANLSFVNPKVLREFISSYNGITKELSRIETPKAIKKAVNDVTIDNQVSVFDAINEITGSTTEVTKFVNSLNGAKTVTNMHSFLNRTESILKENTSTLSPELNIIKNELRDILIKYPEVTNNIEGWYLGFTESRTGLAKALSTATKADLIAFKEHLSGLNRRDGLELQRWDYWLTPDSLQKKHAIYDPGMYRRISKVMFISQDEGSATIKTASIVTPLSRMSKLVKVQNAIDNIYATKVKIINEDWARNPINLMVATLNKQANIGTQVLSLSTFERMLTDISATPERLADLTKKRDGLLIELKDHVNKSFVVKDANGVEVSMSFKEIVSFIVKEYDPVFDDIWNKSVDNGIMQAKLEKEGLEIDGWIDYNTVIDKLGGLVVAEDYAAFEGLGVNNTFISKLLHTKRVFEMSFEVNPQENNVTLRAIDIVGDNPKDTLIRRVKFIKQMIKLHPDYENLILTPAEKIKQGYFPIISTSENELKNIFQGKLSALKKQYQNEFSATGIPPVKLLTQIVQTLQDYHFKLGDFGLTDDGIIEMVTSFVDIKDLSEPSIRKIISATPGNLKARSKDDYITKFDTSINVVTNYAQNLEKSNLKRLAGLIMDSQITKFQKETMEGKNFVGKENAEPWANFMRLSARDFSGYPSLTPKAWRDDPKMKIQGNPYRFFTDDFWLEKYKSISKAIGIKESELPDFITDPMKINKLVWISNLDAKWNLASLLFSPKQALSNILGASQNTLSLAGWKYFKQANDIGFLSTINKEWTSWSKVMTDLEKHGAFEAYLSAELNLATRVTGSNWQSFISRALKKIKSDPSVEDTTLKEIAKEEGITDDIWNKSAFFMRKSERFIRARTWLSFYLKWRDVLDINQHTTTWDDPWLIKLANEGVYSTQFLYNTASKSAAMRTSVGKVLTRFQQWALKSVELRSELVKNAKAYGYNENSEEYTRFRNLITTDMFIASLASIFPMSLFSASTPPPISYMKDLSAWIFGDKEEKEKAFYGILPYPANIIKPILPPSSRFITDTFSLMSGDTDRFLSTQVWTWFPFGRFARDSKKTFENPALFGERMLGVPMLTLAKYASNVRKGKYPTKPRASLSFGEEPLDVSEETKETGSYQAYGSPKKKLTSDEKMDAAINSLKQ